MNTTDINIGMAGFSGGVPIVEIASGEPKPIIRNEFYSAADLGIIFGSENNPKSRSTINRWEQSGKIPKRVPQNFGDESRWCKDQINEHIRKIKAGIKVSYD